MKHLLLIICILTHISLFSQIKPQDQIENKHNNINLHLDTPSDELKTVSKFYIYGSLISITGSILALYSASEIKKTSSTSGNYENKVSLFKALKYLGISSFAGGLGIGFYGYCYARKNRVNTNNIEYYQ